MNITTELAIAALIVGSMPANAANQAERMFSAWVSNCTPEACLIARAIDEKASTVLGCDAHGGQLFEITFGQLPSRKIGQVFAVGVRKVSVNFDDGPEIEISGEPLLGDTRGFSGEVDAEFVERMKKHNFMTVDLPMLTGTLAVRFSLKGFTAEYSKIEGTCNAVSNNPFVQVYSRWIVHCDKEPDAMTDKIGCVAARAVRKERMLAAVQCADDDKGPEVEFRSLNESHLIGDDALVRFDKTPPIKLEAPSPSLATGSFATRIDDAFITKMKEHQSMLVEVTTISGRKRARFSLSGFAAAFDQIVEKCR